MLSVVGRREDLWRHHTAETLAVLTTLSLKLQLPLAGEMVVVGGMRTHLLLIAPLHVAARSSTHAHRRCACRYDRHRLEAHLHASMARKQDLRVNVHGRMPSAQLVSSEWLQPAVKSVPALTCHGVRQHVVGRALFPFSAHRAKLNRADQRNGPTTKSGYYSGTLDAPCSRVL